MSDEEWIFSAYYSRDQQAQMYGLIDTLFMSFYAIGLFASGILGDRYDLTKIISGGMIATAVILALFGFGALFGIRSLGFYAFLWSLNGLVQSSGFPANVAVMGKWFDKVERGAVLGIWSGNACFGNIVGTAFIALTFSLFDKAIAWKLALVVIAFFVALQGIIIYFLLVADPEDALMRHRRIEDAKPRVASMDEQSKADVEGIAFLRAWCIPGVLSYALCYACLKSVNYALFFWLPFYLSVSLHMDNSTAASVSMLYDLGQIVGGFIGGYVSDRLGVRSPVIVVMLLLSCAIIHAFAGASRGEMSILLLASGFMTGGPANLISTAISADLGTHPSIKGNAAALSTVAGIIDGTGSIGAAFVQYLVGYLANCHKVPSGCDNSDPNCIQVCNWDPVFVLLELGTVLSCVCLARLLYQELFLTHEDNQDE